MLSITHSAVVAELDDGISPVGSNEWNNVHTISGLGTGVQTFLETPSSANLRAALTDEVGGGAAVFGAAGSDTQVQFNNGGAFGGDANFSWGIGKGFTSKIATVLGNKPAVLAVDVSGNPLTSIDSHPGDPTQSTTITARDTLVVNPYFSGDLANTVVSQDGITMWAGCKHTGASPANMTGMDNQIWANSDSSGPWGSFTAVNGLAINYGTGNLSVMRGGAFGVYNKGSANVDITWVVQIFADYSPVGAAGSIGDSKLVRIQSPTRGATTVIDHVGIWLGDQSGFGSNTSNNIFSQGVTSLNVFEGIVNIGQYIEMPEISAPSAPATNKGRLFFQDNGAGKTQLVVRFPTGAIQVIATEP